MTFSIWIGFVLTLLVALAVPGPDFVVVVQAASRGWRTAALTVVGVMTGLSIHAGLATAGLAALLVALPQALDALRVCGAGVLVWLALRMLNSARKATGTDPVDGGRSHPYRRGFVVDVSNPKTPIFFGAVLPQFIGRGHSTTAGVIPGLTSGITIDTAILGLTVVLVSGAFWLTVVLVVRVLRIGRSATAGRIVTASSGALLLTVAVLLAAPILQQLPGYAAKMI